MNSRCFAVEDFRAAPDPRRRQEVHELDFHQRAIGAVVDIDRLAAALMLDPQQQRGRRGHQRAAGLDDQLRAATMPKLSFDRLRDGVEVEVHRRRFARRVGGRIAAADIEALERDAGTLGDAAGRGDVALIGLDFLALRADMEAQAG